MKFPIRHIALTLFIILCVAITARAKTTPRLVVNIVISSMNANDLERYAGNFSSTGIRRLINGGQSFTNATYDYMQTSTPTSLATLSTGATPSTHGVVSDRWFDYVTNQHVLLINDDEEHSVKFSSGSGNYSPRNLMAQSLLSIRFP